MRKKSISIVVLILLFLVSLELVLRFIQPYLSKDLKHYMQMNSLINKHDKITGKKILFIGNSLTREGIQPQAYKDQSMHITLINPDDTSISEWSWIFKNMVYDRNNIHELNIVFAGGQLKDKRLQEQNLVSISHIINAVDIADVIKFERLTLSDSITLVLAHISAVFSSRERIQRRILDLLPYYREQSQLINQSLNRDLSLRQVSSQKNAYRHLKMLIKLAKEKDIHITFIAAPLPKVYSLDNNLINIFNRYKVDFIDGRSIQEIHPSDFSDGYHLNEVGAEKFTRYIIVNQKLNEKPFFIKEVR